MGFRRQCQLPPWHFILTRACVVLTGCWLAVPGTLYLFHVHKSHAAAVQWQQTINEQAAGNVAIPLMEEHSIEQRNALSHQALLAEFQGMDREAIRYHDDLASDSLGLLRYSWVLIPFGLLLRYVVSGSLLPLLPLRERALPVHEK